MSVTKGTLGSVYIKDSGSVFAAQACTEDGSTMIYQINDVARRIWDPERVTTVSTGTIDVGWMDRGIDYFTGRFKLTTTGASPTCGQAACVITQVACVYNWALNLGTEAADVTPIGDTWRSVAVMHNTASVTISRYRWDARMEYVTSTLSTVEFVLLKLMENDTTRFWVKAAATAFGLTQSVGAVTDEPRSFEVSGPVSRV